jgi:hypothetical protein
MRVILADKWSGDVKTKWKAPEGLFTKSAETIANELYKSHDDLKGASSALTFYINRAGSNLSDADKEKFDKVRELLHKKFA